MSDLDSDSSTNRFESLTTSSSGSGGVVVRPSRGAPSTSSSNSDSEDSNDISPRRRAWQNRIDDLTDSDDEDNAKLKKNAKEQEEQAAREKKLREEEEAKKKLREEEEAKENDRKARAVEEEKRKKELESRRADEKRQEALRQKAAEDSRRLEKEEEAEKERKEGAARGEKLRREEEARQKQLEAEKQQQQTQNPPEDALSDEEELRREREELEAVRQNRNNEQQEQTYSDRSPSPSLESLPDGTEETPVKQVIKITPVDKSTITLEEIRTHMMELYEKHDPSKISTVDDILSTYPGREANFLDALSKRFNGVPFFSPKSRAASPMQTPSRSTSPTKLERQFVSLLSSPFLSTLEEYPDFKSYCQQLPSEQYSFIKSNWSASKIDSLHSILVDAVKNRLFNVTSTTEKLSSPRSQQSPSDEILQNLLSMSLKEALRRYERFEGFYNQLSEDRKIPFSDWSMRNSGKLKAILSPCISLGYFSQPTREVARPSQQRQQQEEEDEELPDNVKNLLSIPLLEVCESFPSIMKYLETLSEYQQGEFEQNWGLRGIKKTRVHLIKLIEMGCFKSPTPPSTSKNLDELKGVLAVSFNQTLLAYPNFKSELRELTVEKRVMIESNWGVENVEKLSHILDGFIECFRDSESDVILQDVLSSHSSLEEAKSAFPNLSIHLKEVDCSAVDIIQNNWSVRNLTKLAPILRGIIDAFTISTEPICSPSPDDTDPIIEKLLSGTFQNVLTTYPLFKSKFEMLESGKRVIIESNWGTQNIKKLTPLLLPFIKDDCFNPPDLDEAAESTSRDVEVISNALSQTFQEVSLNKSFREEFNKLDSSKRIILESNWGIQNTKKLTPILLPFVKLNCFTTQSDENEEGVVEHLLSQPFDDVIDSNPGFKSAFQKMELGQKIHLESNWSVKNTSKIKTTVTALVDSNCFGKSSAKEAEIILNIISKPLQDVFREFPKFKERFHVLNGGDRVMVEELWGSTQNFNKLESKLAVLVSEGCFEPESDCGPAVTPKELLSLPLKEVCQQYPSFKQGFDGLSARDRICIECNWGFSPDRMRKTEHILNPLLQQTIPNLSPSPTGKETKDPEERETPADGMFRPVISTQNSPAPVSPFSIDQCENDDKGIESLAAGDSSQVSSKGVTVIINGNKSVVKLPDGSDISDLLQHCATTNDVELESLPAGELQALDQSGSTLSNRLDLSKIASDKYVTIRKRAPLSIPSPVTPTATVKQVVIAPPVTPPEVGIPPLPITSTPPTQEAELHTKTPIKASILSLEVGCTATANRIPLAPSLKGRRGIVQSIKGDDVSIQFPRPWGTRVISKELLRVVAPAPISAKPSSMKKPSAVKKPSVAKTPLRKSSAMKSPIQKSSAVKAKTARVRKTEVGPGAWEINEGTVHQTSQISLTEMSSPSKRRVPLRSKSVEGRKASWKPSSEGFDASFVREWKFSPSTVIKPFSYSTLVGKGKSIQEEVPCPDCGTELGKGGYCKVSGAAHLVEEPSKPRRLTQTEQEVSTNRMAIAPEVSQKRWVLQDAKDSSMTPPPNGFARRSRTPSPSRTPRRQLNLHLLSNNSDSIIKDRKKKKKKTKKKKVKTYRSPGHSDHFTESPGSELGTVIIKGLHEPFLSLNGTYQEIRRDRYRNINSDATISHVEGRWRLNDTRDKNTWLFSFDHLFGQWKRSPTNSHKDFCGVAGCAYPHITKATPSKSHKSPPSIRKTETGDPMTIQIQNLELDRFEHLNGTYELCSRRLYQHIKESAIIYYSDDRWRLNDTDDITGWIFSNPSLLGQWFEDPTSADFTAVVGCKYPLVTHYAPPPIPESTLRRMLRDFYRNIGVGIPSGKIQSKVDKFLGGSSTDELTNFLLRKYPNSTEADMPWCRYEYVEDDDKSANTAMLQSKINSPQLNGNTTSLSEESNSKTLNGSQPLLADQLVDFFSKNDPKQTIEDVNQLTHRFENDRPALGSLLLQKYPNLSEADLPFLKSGQHEVPRQMEAQLAEFFSIHDTQRSRNDITRLTDRFEHDPQGLADLLTQKYPNSRSDIPSEWISSSQTQMETDLAAFFKKHDDRRTPVDISRLTDRFEHDQSALAELLIQSYPNSVSDIPELWVEKQQSEMEYQLSEFFKKHDTERTQSDIKRLAERFENDCDALGELLLQKYPNSEQDIPWLLGSSKKETSDLLPQLKQFFEKHDPKHPSEDVIRLSEQFGDNKPRLSEILLQKYPDSIGDMVWNSDTAVLREQLEEYFNIEDPLIHASEIQALVDSYKSDAAGLTEHLEKKFPKSIKNMPWVNQDGCSILSGAISPVAENKCSELLLEQQAIQFFNKNDPLMQTAEIKSLLQEIQFNATLLTKSVLKSHPGSESDMRWLCDVLPQMLDNYFEKHDPLKELFEIKSLSTEYQNNLYSLSTKLLKQYPNTKTDMEWWSGTLESEVQSYLNKHNSSLSTILEVRRLIQQHDDSSNLAKSLLSKYPNTESDILWWTPPAYDATIVLQSQISKYFSRYKPSASEEDSHRLAKRYQSDTRSLTAILLGKYPGSRKEMLWDDDGSSFSDETGCSKESPASARNELLLLKNMMTLENQHQTSHSQTQHEEQSEYSELEVSFIRTRSQLTAREKEVLRKKEEHNRLAAIKREVAAAQEKRKREEAEEKSRLEAQQDIPEMSPSRSVRQEEKKPKRDDSGCCVIS